MTRTAAFESATRLAAASGLHYRVYRRETGAGWQVVDGILMADDAFYTIYPDGRATFQLGLGCTPKLVQPAR
jgi:hypothetical protein